MTAARKRPTSLAEKQRRQQAQDVAKVIDALERVTEILAHLEMRGTTPEIKWNAEVWNITADDLLTEIIDFNEATTKENAR